jgi:amidase
VGTSKEELPLGVQVVATSWRDDIALAVAAQLEVLFGGWQAPRL